MILKKVEKYTLSYTTFRMKKVEPIRDSVPTMIKETLSYLRTNVVKKRIVKPKDDEHSDKFYNYPYQALEEAVVNSLYNRDWTIRVSERQKKILFNE